MAIYILAYGLLNLLMSTALPLAADDGARDRLDNLKGLFHRSHFAALMIGLAMLSPAGIPPLPGFIGKFLIFKNVIAAGYATYAVRGQIGSYLRVHQFIFMSLDAVAPAGDPVRRVAVRASVACRMAALVVAAFPGWMMAHW